MATQTKIPRPRARKLSPYEAFLKDLEIGANPSLARPYPGAMTLPGRGGEAAKLMQAGSAGPGIGVAQKAWQPKLNIPGGNEAVARMMAAMQAAARQAAGQQAAQAVRGMPTILSARSPSIPAPEGGVISPREQFINAKQAERLAQKQGTTIPEANLLGWQGAMYSPGDLPYHPERSSWMSGTGDYQQVPFADVTPTRGEEGQTMRDVLHERHAALRPQYAPMDIRQLLLARKRGVPLPAAMLTRDVLAGKELTPEQMMTHFGRVPAETMTAAGAIGEGRSSEHHERRMEQLRTEAIGQVMGGLAEGLLAGGGAITEPMMGVLNSLLKELSGGTIETDEDRMRKIVADSTNRGEAEQKAKQAGISPTIMNKHIPSLPKGPHAGSPVEAGIWDKIGGIWEELVGGMVPMPEPSVRVRPQIPLPPDLQAEEEEQLQRELRQRRKMPGRKWGRDWWSNVGSLFESVPAMVSRFPGAR